MFNPIGLMENSKVVIPTTDIPNIYAMKEKSHSFFIETLNFLSEANSDFYEAKRVYYRSLTEATGTNDMTVVHESFGDFFDKIRAIIDKFLAFIKSMFERFVTMLNKLIGRDKHILNNKEKLRNFSRIHEFDITGFTFTFNEAIPTIDAKAKFEEDFVFNLASSNGTDKITLSGNNKTVASNIKAASTTLTNNLADGTWYDSFRASVLGDDTGVISKDDFASALFATFRNDDSIAEQFTVDNAEVMAALRRFESSKSDIDKVKRLKAKIDSDYNSVKKSVESMVKTNRAGGVVSAQLDDRLNTAYTLTNDDIVAMDNFAKVKINQIQEMSNIHALAFAAKLDAMTDCYKQDKTVLFKALSRVESTKKEEV